MTLRCKYILFGLLAIVLIALLVWVLPGEPRSNGKTLSQWLDVLAKEGDDNARAEAQAAVREIGTNALPWLLPMMRAEEFPVKSMLRDMVNRQSLVDLYWKTPPSPKSRAIAGFGALGELAAPAIPGLVRLFTDEVARGRGLSTEEIALALAGIGQMSVPPLICLLTNQPEDILASDAAYSLGIIGTNARSAIPVLIRCLKDEKLWLTASASAEALGRIGQDSVIIVPALIQSLHDRSNSAVRTSAAAAFGGVVPGTQVGGSRPGAELE